MLARQYDFVKVGLGELELDDGGLPTLDKRTNQFRVKSELYPVSSFASHHFYGSNPNPNAFLDYTNYQ